ncbi:MAG: hypothetical protein GC159_11640 [Phycisphaera sp.]|nr:hypothetical protein [Phycisphaera sp.]
MKKRTKTIALVGLLIVVVLGGLIAYPYGSRWLRWRHLDQTYQEQFQPPVELAPAMASQHIVFHVKTGLAQDDSQICVGFNVIFAALEADADVTIIFDAGAILDLNGELASTGVPLRLRKVIAAQMNLPLEQMPTNYGEYLGLLHDRGAKVYANTAMLIVTGDASQVQEKLSRYPYIEPAPYAQIARLLSQADSMIVY